MKQFPKGPGAQKEFAPGRRPAGSDVRRPARTQGATSDGIFRYATSYRFYTLAKIGFSLAFLWHVWDFLWIHVALWNGFDRLLGDVFAPAPPGAPGVYVLLHRVAVFAKTKAITGLFVGMSPVAVGLYLWGRCKWVQFAVGCWMSASIVCLGFLLEIFHSTADVWLNFVFVTYAVVALTSSADAWENSERGFSLSQWRDNPICSSAYAWLIVLLQFSVYFFAGLYKLVDGWIPWTTGTAIQHLLAFDNTFRPFVRGASVPYWASLILCYVTLAQRLVVPFGFYFRRWRIWSVLILGLMHVGYAILMSVNLFPLMGISCLMMVWPPRESAAAPSKAKSPEKPSLRRLVVQRAVICLFSLFLLEECLRLAPREHQRSPLEVELMMEPAWRMFSDGGAVPGEEWRLFFDTPQGRVDVTDLATQPLPHSWRDRLYLNTIYYELVENRYHEPDSFVNALVLTTEKKYVDQAPNGQRTIRHAEFEVRVKRNTFVLPIPQQTAR